MTILGEGMSTSTLQRKIPPREIQLETDWHHIFFYSNMLLKIKILRDLSKLYWSNINSLKNVLMIKSSNLLLFVKCSNLNLSIMIFSNSFPQSGRVPFWPGSLKPFFDTNHGKPGIKGIRRWQINWFIYPMMIHKITTSAEYN